MSEKKHNEENKDLASTETAEIKPDPMEAKGNTKTNKEENKTDKIAQLFKSNPLHKQLYQTSDGYFFIHKSLAKKHSTTLESKKVDVIVKQQNKSSENESEN